ncbi:trypsin-like serine peptidase [Synechocystis sp. PCC 7509]|uniref:trypsin-like serine peptidase n=1 Tax=Synechocystis sp. PCC 7509 TaxID=927677 RepID=UPI0002AC1DED|nr:hypothetical protein [Synechocystis sp. PCC 7509]
MNKYHQLVVSLGVLTVLGQETALGQNRDEAVILKGQQQQLSTEAIKNAAPHKNYLSPLNLPNLAPTSEAEFRQNSASPGISSQAKIPNNNLINSSTSTSTPRAFGSYGVPYTSKRVSHFPTSVVSSNANGYLSATYPYSTMGRLAFSVGTNNAHCSATLIRRSIIVTAAHCIQGFGSGSSIYSNFTFVPSYYNAIAPYGSWSWLSLVRPSSWANGTDTGSGAARNNDLAVIAIRKNSAGQFIGDITGYMNYGWNNYSFTTSSRTGNIPIAAITTTGYPGLLDLGRIMQRSDGPGYLTTISSAKQIYQGSNFTGGSSGGAWVTNFGYQSPAFSGGASAGNSSVPNVIVGVTSWGASDPNLPKDNYSSQFGQNTQYPLATYGTRGAGNIASILNTLCSSTPSGSTQTLQQQGYCN